MSIVGGDYRRTAQETRFWVGVWVGDAINPTAVYESHQFSPSKAAICPNPILDLIATADELGHIHVWHYRTTVREWKEPLKPKARPLWGVRWTDDQQLAYARDPMVKMVSTSTDTDRLSAGFIYTNVTCLKNPGFQTALAWSYRKTVPRRSKLTCRS